MIDPSFLIHIAHASETATTEVQNSGLAGTLGLNLKLFIAQLVNFAVVLFVLWKWVFTPVTRALQNRTERIEKSLQDAETVSQERIHFNEWKQKEMQKVRVEAGEVIANAKSEADALKTSMLIEAKHEQEKIVAKTKKQLELEQSQAIATIKTQISELVVTATEKILKDKLTGPKDKELIKKALDEI